MSEFVVLNTHGCGGQMRTESVRVVAESPSHAAEQATGVPDLWAEAFGSAPEAWVLRERGVTSAKHDPVMVIVAKVA